MAPSLKRTVAGSGDSKGFEQRLASTQRAYAVRITLMLVKCSAPPGRLIRPKSLPECRPPDAANNLTAVYRVGDREWNGARAVPGTDKVRITYRNSTSVVVTDLTLDRNAVTRSVRATTAATEQIPLVLQPGDVVTWANGTASPYDTTTSANTTGITIKRGAATITVSWGTAHAATLSTSTRTYLRDGTKRVHILRVRHTGAIDVVITVN
jgi:hypothetical protein